MSANRSASSILRLGAALLEPAPGPWRTIGVMVGCGLGVLGLWIVADSTARALLGLDQLRKDVTGTSHELGVRVEALERNQKAGETSRADLADNLRNVRDQIRDLGERVTKIEA